MFVRQVFGVINSMPPFAPIPNHCCYCVLNSHELHQSLLTVTECYGVPLPNCNGGQGGLIDDFMYLEMESIGDYSAAAAVKRSLGRGTDLFH